MPLPWYINTITKLLAFPLLPVYPFILILEAMRGAFLSGTSLGLFIDIPANPPQSADRELKRLRGYLDRNEDLLLAVPPIFLPLLGPWIDYHHACEIYFDICTELYRQKEGIADLPDTCAPYWTRTFPPETPS